MTGLEKEIDEKIRPLLDRAMQKTLGITVNEIASDISDRLLKTPLADMVVEQKFSYKRAKDAFRRWFLVKMLMLNCGNVSEVARKCAINRRSIHRMLKKYKIDINKLREELIKRDYVKRTAISSMIETTVKNYEQGLNPAKLEEFYKDVPSLSRQILEELPEETMTLKAAEKEFDKRYFKKILEENTKIPVIAKKIKLRQETLYRKLKKLEIR
jgi:DNA-binding NtrC family response regulator